MRGKAAETLTGSGWIGITPAYAGKSMLAITWSALA